MTVPDETIFLELMLNAPMGICIMDAATQVSEVVNDAFLEVAGRSRDQIVGHYYWDTFAEVRHLFEADLNRASKGEIIRGEELEIPLIRFGKQEEITINFIYMPLKNAAGNVSKVAVWVVDNTKEVKARQEIAASEGRLSALVAATSDVVYSLSADWEIMHPLDGRGFLQDTSEPISGWRHQNVHPDEMERVNIAIDEAIRDKKIFQLEHQVLRADGSPGWTFSRAVPILGTDGEINEWFGMASDITERKQAVESLEQAITKRKDEERQLQLMINMLPASVVVIRGQELIVEMINQANLDYWKRTANEVIGKPFLDILPDLADQPFAGQLRHVMATGEVLDVKESPVLFENPDGSIRETYVDYTYQPLTDADGNRNGVLVMSFEITDRVIARRQVEQSEENLRAMIAQAPVAMCILTGPDHVITIANQLMVELWGKPQEQLMNRPVFEALPDARGQGLEQLMQEVYETGETFYASEMPVSLVRHGKPEVVYQNFFYQAYRDNAGVIAGIFAITVDVSEQVTARAELQRINQELSSSATRLQMAIESTNLGTWEYHPQTGALYWSKECREVYGLAQHAQPTYEDFAAHIHPDDREFVESAIQGALDPQGKGSYDLSYRINRFDNGEARWIKAQGRAYFENEKAARFIGTVVDIHELKEAEEKSAKLAAIIETSHDAIVSKTLEGIITSWNKSAERVFGYTAEEMIGESIYKLIPPERHSEEPHILSTIARGERINHFETKRRTKDGRLIDVSVTVSPVTDKAGRIIGVSKIARDITEKKLDEARKNDFIGMVSHELKTPLTSLSAILQVANLKVKDSPDKFLPGAMEKANQQVKRMSTLINGFLNISRLEAGKIHIEKQPFDLTALVREVVDEMALTANTHHLTFEQTASITVNADREKIASVISNYISNAVKYSPKGQLVLINLETNATSIILSVKDEGMGIKPADLSRIFDRYYRVETNHTRHIAGFGIGLYLSSEIIAGHGGKVWAESESGVGSTFFFSLPSHS